MLLKNAAQNNPFFFIKIAQYIMQHPPLSVLPSPNMHGGGTLLAIFLDPSFAQLAESTAISVCGPYSHSLGAFTLLLVLLVV